MWTDAKGKQYVWDEDNVILGKSGKLSVLSRIIFNLIADSRLVNPFSIEQLIDLLVSDSLIAKDGKLYEVYTRTYKKRFSGLKGKLAEIKDLEEICGSLDKKRTTKIIELGGKLVDMLDKSANIAANGDTYVFQYRVDGKVVEMEQEEDVLDTWFSSGLWPFSIM